MATASAPAAVAREAGLNYVSDVGPGIRRVRRGRSFGYLGPDGRPIRDPETLGRIRALVIPPAWTEVWICPDPRGHIQATGRDERGRKQYRYHARWRSIRDEAKYGRTLDFARALPGIRRATERDLARPGLPRRKVLAAVVRLLELTLIRLGNDEYARANRSFGLTTLRNHHARIEGTTLVFRFRGKSGIRHEVSVDDCRLARVVARCQELPGQELLEYVDETGAIRDVGSQDVNEYLREITGEEFTAKDFRTWAGTVRTMVALREIGAFDSKTQARKNVLRAIETVAKCLGNTPRVCRQCYVHPGILTAYLDGTLPAARALGPGEATSTRCGLSRDESAVLALLRRRMAADAPRDCPPRDGARARGSPDLRRSRPA